MKKTFYTRGNGLLEGFLAKKRARLANGFIPNRLYQGKILDVGCGSYPFFLTTVKIKNKYGIDPSVDLSLAKKNSMNLKKIAIDKSRLPFPDNFFDAVTLLAVFEHIDNDKLKFALNEVRRVLKQDGITILTTPAPWADRLLHFMAVFGLISKVEIHEHKHNQTKAAVENTLIGSGFDQSKIKSGFFEMGFNMWFTAQK